MAEKDSEKKTSQQQETSAETNPSILQSYIEYAELCSDPLEVFKYLENKKVCLTDPTYWIEKMKLYCKMGEFRKAVTELTALNDKAVQNGSEDCCTFMSQIDKQLQFVEQQLQKAIKMKTTQKRSIDLYEATRDKPQESSHLLSIDRALKHKQLKSRLIKLLDVFENECQDSRNCLQQEFQTSQKNKPRCSLNNDLLSSNPKIKRTHSILRKNFSHLANKAQSLSPSKNKPQLFRKETLDSIQMAKKKKTRLNTSSKTDENQKLQDSRMCKTTSFLEMRHVYFGATQSHNRIEKFRNTDNQNQRHETIEGVDLKQEFNRQKKSGNSFANEHINTEDNPTK